MAGSLAPGAGLADASGMYYSPMQGGQVPGLLENLREGGYGTAVMQGLGLLGDATYAGGPILGATIGTALKAPAAVGKGIKAAQAAPTSQPVQEGIRAYQGSPHDFAAERLVRYPDGRTEYIVGAPDVLPDIPAGAEVLRDFPMGRMRMDKIGTGEGAQAYGHGLYAADAEGVAREYRLSLSPQYREIVGYAGPDRAKNAAAYLAAGIDRADILDALRALDDPNPELSLRLGRKILDEAEQTGRMYEIRINANPEDFLDWDAPIRNQSPNVRNALGVNNPNEEALRTRLAYLEQEASRRASLADTGSIDAFFAPNPEFDALILEAQEIRNTLQRGVPSNHPFAHLQRSQIENMTGADIARPYSQYQEGRFDNSRQAAEALRAAGIPGIRYLDQVSRGAGEGTRNYVVFDESLIDILRKYGIVGLLGGGLLTGGVLSQQEAQTVPGS